MIERNRYQVSASTSQVLSFLNITITLSFLLKIVFSLSRIGLKYSFYYPWEAF